jgi:hypothetical protein
MTSTDLGESLVGAYLRHIENCSMVLYNSFSAGTQGEVDVVGVKSPQEPGCPRLVYVCEATTNIGGMARNAVARVPAKLKRLSEFAEATFPGGEHRYQWWSPYVSEGATTKDFDELSRQWKADGRSLEFVINGEYTRRVAKLVEHARCNPSTTNEPAYRMLQILTHLRGDKPTL